MELCASINFAEMTTVTYITRWRVDFVDPRHESGFLILGFHHSQPGVVLCAEAVGHGVVGYSVGLADVIGDLDARLGKNISVFLSCHLLVLDGSDQLLSLGLSTL